MPGCERFREPLPIVSGAERRWDDYDVKVAKAAEYGSRWKESEIEYVILNPTLTFDGVGRDLGRSPGAVRRIRYAFRVVAGAIPESPKAPIRPGLRLQIVNVLERLAFMEWTAAERGRYLNPGRGRESDKTRKAELVRRGLSGSRTPRLATEGEAG